MNIKKYLGDSRDAQRIVQHLESGPGSQALDVIRKRREEKIDSLVNISVEKITEKEIASRTGEIRGLNFLIELLEQAKTITDRE